MTDKASASERRPGITAITSGKGGVGKTFLSANPAAALTRQGGGCLWQGPGRGVASGVYAWLRVGNWCTRGHLVVLLRLRLLRPVVLMRPWRPQLLLLPVLLLPGVCAYR